MRHLMLALLVGCSACHGVLAQAANSVQNLLSARPSPRSRKVAAELPAEDGRDADFADRGYLGTLADPVIKTKDGKPVWNLDAYAWMDGKSPDTVNPSLWRHMGLLRKHGLLRAVGQYVAGARV